MQPIEVIDSRVQVLRQQIEATEAQLRNLKVGLQQVEQEAEASLRVGAEHGGGFPAEWKDETLSALQEIEAESIARQKRQDQGGPNGVPASAPMTRRWPLVAKEYKRYGRQLIMPEAGLRGQLRLKNTKILIVGLGGLGCPAAAYLAGAGVGTLGLVDGDAVEESNLHRQIAHNTTRVGMSKVDSAHEYLRSLNPLVCYNRYRFQLSPENAVSIFQQYDLILDCTDHPTSRYLISDACVLTGKPLVSASALKTEGQLMVLNNPTRPAGDASGGPCYRCIFPKPPPAESVLSCGEGGILGPVVGVMGVLQALEAIKVITNRAKAQSEDVAMSISDAMEPVKPTLLMFSAYSNPQFRSVRLRSRRIDCAACSTLATIVKETLTRGSLDYVAFCGATAAVNVLPSEARITASDFARLSRDYSQLLIDTRDETQYAICALRGSVNVPWTGNADTWLEEARQMGALEEDGQDKYVVCRLGNDSQLAAKAIIDHAGIPSKVKDIKGGFEAWREEVDSTWPDY